MKSGPITIIKYLTHLFLLTFITIAHGQDPLRFAVEIEKLTRIEHSFNKKDKIILFTGSSSIRMWEDLQSCFPEHKIINNGFNNSHMSDLLYYVDELILNYSPDKIIIYEGDNDIASGKTTSEIIITTKELIRKIERKIPDAEIILISVKPSPARWVLKEEYESLNKKFEIFGQKNNNVSYVDVWNAMLDETGNPKKELFLNDGLHMNKSGYNLWGKEITKFLD